MEIQNDWEKCGTKIVGRFFAINLQSDIIARLATTMIRVLLKPEQEPTLLLDEHHVAKTEKVLSVLRDLPAVYKSI